MLFRIDFNEKERKIRQLHQQKYSLTMGIVHTGTYILGLDLDSWINESSRIERTCATSVYTCCASWRRVESVAKTWSTFTDQAFVRLWNACQVWHSSLSKNLSDDLERVQKRALRVAYGPAGYMWLCIPASRCVRTREIIAEEIGVVQQTFMWTWKAQITDYTMHLIIKAGLCIRICEPLDCCQCQELCGPGVLAKVLAVVRR